MIVITVWVSILIVKLVETIVLVTESFRAEKAVVIGPLISAISFDGTAIVSNITELIPVSFHHSVSVGINQLVITAIKMAIAVAIVIVHKVRVAINDVVASCSGSVPENPIDVEIVQMGSANVAVVTKTIPAAVMAIDVTIG